MTLHQTDGVPHSFSFNYLRMEPDMFDELVQRVGPRIGKHDTKIPFRFSSNEIRMREMLLECCKSI